MSDITWRLSEAEAVGLLEILTDLKDVLESDEGDEDAETLRLEGAINQLGDLIQQQREYDAAFQPQLEGLA